MIKSEPRNPVPRMSTTVDPREQDEAYRKLKNISVSSQGMNKANQGMGLPNQGISPPNQGMGKGLAGLGLAEQTMGKGLAGSGSAGLAGQSKGIPNQGMNLPNRNTNLTNEGAGSTMGKGLAGLGSAGKMLKKGGKVKATVSSASKRADGVATKGKTKGRFV